jgi:hypothetical protein
LFSFAGTNRRQFEKGTEGHKMNSQTLSGPFLRSVVALGLVLAVVGCSKAAPTKQVVVPTPSPQASPTVETTDQPSLAPTSTPAPSATPAPSSSPTAVAVTTPAATPTPASTAGSGIPCTGTAEHLAFFAEAANALSFDVYCAALPSNWWLSATEYKQSDGGYLTISYKNLGGDVVTVGEGNFCPGVATCWASASDLGSASFGDLGGSLKTLASGQYAVFVSPDTSSGYQITGKGMSQADFVAMAAAMVKVAKS